MSTMVKAKIVKIGNSKGVRIPKLILDRLGFGSEVQMEMKKDTLVIRAAAKDPREGWEESAREAHANGDDVLLDGYIPTKFDEEEWEW